MSAPRRLYRSRHDQILGGVAAGMAKYFALDPTLVRLAWLAIILWAGAGLPLYIIAWIIIPLEPEGSGDETAAGEDAGSWGRRDRSIERDRNALGWLLVVVGLGLILFNMGLFRWLFNPAVMLAVLFIVLGLFLLGKKERPPRVR